VSARYQSQRSFFVIEADEYDTAFFDKRSKFVHYRPRTAILNNLEYDHADIFPDLAAIETQFHHLLRTVPRSGLVLAPAQDQALARVLARGCYSNLITTGQATGWHTQSVDALSFNVLNGTQLLGQVQWSLTGAHNQHNALVALLAAEHVGVSPAQSIAALNQFAGVKRRMETRGTINGVTVYDDFAHHPTAIQTTLEGLRAKVGAERILAVLEPRSNTMKLGTMAARLPAALATADLVFCFGQNEGKQALGWDPTVVLASLGTRLQAHDQLDALVQALASQARSGDHIVVMSNGGFGGIHTKLLKALATPRA
jgi:UDP-N-acetylmuramate: L-alanyl-gamma-D-glutamyl-meso-diaminopimelate ligase